MKTQSEDFITKEESSERKPAELYHFWRGSTHWRYTSGDVSIIFGGETYAPATIKRGKTQYDTKLETNTITIDVGRVTNPVLEFIASSVYDLVWVSIHKIHRDLIIEETTPIFVGNIKEISFKGVAAKIKCTGFEHFLNQVVPRYRYGPACQHTLYDTQCGLTRDTFTSTITIGTVSTDGLTLTADGFLDKESGYYSFGYLDFAGQSRMIVNHVSTTVNLRYRVPGLDGGDAVTISAGCDKSRTMCENKFNNLINNLSFPDIPKDNPAAWI